MAETESRNYDETQDISSRQMVVLLEVSDRTGADLGQLLATGEFESAHTWNNFVRPPLSSGRLGSATGVWQFQPATFHSIIRLYGAKLLAVTEADPAAGREHLDLGAPPFSDAEVRSLIQETVNGARNAGDEELQLLRHNFAVLAFAKHYLSVDSGAATPEEDALYHILGASLAQRVLKLAQGDARDTLCVKPVEVEPPFAAAGQEVGLGAGSRPTTNASAKPQVMTGLVPQSAVYSQPAPDASPPVSSEWGLAADSPVVLSNPGMFYRDGNGRTQPYTWSEFLKHLGRRVQAKRQPDLVRAKYAVGFELNGGDTPARAFGRKKQTKSIEFQIADGRYALVPETLLTGPLSRDETRWYKRRLAELVSRGEDNPTGTVPPQALAALQQLRFLPSDVKETSTNSPEIRQALRDFRRKVGKDNPDDPANHNLLMPAERVALELYGQRLLRYGVLQALQQDALSYAPDLNRIQEMPAQQQRFAAHYVAELQEALSAQGLLEQRRKKVVWRDKRGRKRMKYRTLPFVGKVDKATLAAFRTLQLSNGLRDTAGVLDAISLRMLGLDPMGSAIFRPTRGPLCAITRGMPGPSMCKIPPENDPSLAAQLGLVPRESGQNVLVAVDDVSCLRPEPADLEAHLSCTTRR